MEKTVLKGRDEAPEVRVRCGKLTRMIVKKICLIFLGKKILPGAEAGAELERMKKMKSTSQPKQGKRHNREEGVVGGSKTVTKTGQLVMQKSH